MMYLKYIYPIIILSFLFESCSEVENAPSLPTVSINTTDTIIYQINGFNTSVTLGLISNDDFFYHTSLMSCGGWRLDKKINGQYKQENNEVKLFPENVIIEEYGEMELDKDGQPIKLDVIMLSYEADSQQIKTSYFRLDIYEHSFLLSEEYIDLFFSDLSSSNDFDRLIEDLKEGKDLYSGYFIGVNSNLNGEKYSIYELPEKWKNQLKKYENQN